MSPDTHPHDDLAVYALDALEPHQREAVDAHLAECPACRAELDGYHETLGHMTVPEEPPDHVWEGITQQIRAAGEGDADGGASASSGSSAVRGEGAKVVGPGSRWPRWLQSGRGLAAAAAVVVVLALGAVTVNAVLGGSDSVAEQAAAAARDSHSTVVKLDNTGGVPAARVVVTKDDDYVLFDGLPALTSGHTYQLWRMGDGVPSSLGVLGDAEGGAAKVSLPSGTKAFAISVEPAGGSNTPTDIVAS